MVKDHRPQKPVICLDHPPLVWLLESAVNNRQTYFDAIIRVSQYSSEDSIQKKAAYHILSATFFD